MIIMCVIKKWRERRKERKELISKSREMLMEIANFFTKDYLKIISDILDKNPDIKGFSTQSSIDKFIYNKQFLFLDAAFTMKLVNIETNVFNEIVYNPGYDIDKYRVIMKHNPDARKLVNTLEDAIKSFNDEKGFTFLSIVTETHSISGCGSYLYADIPTLKNYFKECQTQYV